MFTIIMLISHTLADFVFQTDKIVEEKNKIDKGGYIKHGIGLLATSVPIILILKIWTSFIAIGCILLIIVIHLLLDFGKEMLNNKVEKSKYKKYYRAGLFIGDQILHILSILIITRGVRLEFNFINQFFVNKIFASSLSYEALKNVFIILYISLSGAYFIPFLFDIIYANVRNYPSLLNNKFKESIGEKDHIFIDAVKTGKWLGILERILILIFLYIDKLEAVAMIIALKSLARFKMMDSKIFSEYYLIGTFISMVYAFVGYGVFNLIL